MLRYLTAGESHGPALLAILEGLPAGVPVDLEAVNAELSRRQGGYGRGARMGIERDEAEILSGVRHGRTLGSPVGLLIRNRDWPNWQEVMSPFGPPQERRREVTRPRPGHADLAGGMKYGHRDLRNVLERASARETAARVAVGALCVQLLEELGVRVYSYVVSLGGVEASSPGEGGRNPGPREWEKAWARALSSPFYCPDARVEEEMRRRVDEAREGGDTLGGVFEVVAVGVPPGLGSYAFWDRRLDTRLAAALMGIPGVKGVEVGLGFAASRLPGSRVHDEIFYRPERGYLRETNRAGGLEGGVTNGEPLVLRGAMKPIATLMRPLQSVDIETKEEVGAQVERSDVVAVPAASVVARAQVAFVLAQAVLEKFGGDSLEEVKRHLEGYRRSLERY